MAEVKITADSGGGTVSWKGPSSTTGNAAVQLTLPVDDGTSGQFLKTDGSGNLSWDSAGSTSASDLTSGTLAADRYVTGAIIQVVSNNVTASSDYTLAYYDGDMNDFVNISALNTSITTTRANSNILVNLQFAGEPSADHQNCRYVVNRTISSTTTWFTGSNAGNKVPCIGVLGQGHYDAENTGTAHPPIGLVNYLDDIGTVAAGTQVDYKLMLESGNGAITYNLNHNVDSTDSAGREIMLSYFTLMEIAG